MQYGASLPPHRPPVCTAELLRRRKASGGLVFSAKDPLNSAFLAGGVLIAPAPSAALA
jgi:hypothetical protein